MLHIKRARILTASKMGMIENGDIVIDGNKIVEIGRNLRLNVNCRVIEGDDLWVTPGFIDCHSHISLFNEPTTMPMLRLDGNETSDPITPHMRASDSINPNDPAFAKVRAAGFTVMYTLPGSANCIGGTGIALKMKGKTGRDMIIPDTEAMKFAFGENPKRNYGMDGKTPVTRMAVASLIRQTLQEARNYEAKKKHAESMGEFFENNFKLDALLPLLNGKQKARMHCHRVDDIVSAITIAEEFGLDYVLEHVTEGHMITEFLREKKPTCVVGPIHFQPVKQEIWNRTYENAAILNNAGLKVSLSADAASATEWLPSQVGFLRKYGLDFDMALRGLTINPAEVMGLEHRIGSLEAGKDADIAIFDDLPFLNTAKCLFTIIDGEVFKN